MEFRFFEPPRETKIGSKNRRVREIGGKIATQTLTTEENDEIERCYDNLISGLHFITRQIPTARFTCREFVCKQPTRFALYKDMTDTAQSSFENEISCFGVSKHDEPQKQLSINLPAGHLRPRNWHVSAVL